MRRRFLVAALAAAGLLAACGRGADDPGTLDADDQRQLNEAAAMLDANSVDAATANAAAP